MNTVSLKQSEFAVQGTTSVLGVLKFVLIVTLVAISLTALGWGYTTFRDWRRDAPRRDYVRNAETLMTALHQYRARTGTFPAGNNAEVVKALTGKNIPLLAIVPTQLQQNAKGQFIDTWGTALQIYIAGNDVLIRSAGPNMVFDDARSEEYDDVILAN
jgi:hypothetical protein